MNLLFCGLYITASIFLLIPVSTDLYYLYQSVNFFYTYIALSAVYVSINKHKQGRRRDFWEWKAESKHIYVLICTMANGHHGIANNPPCTSREAVKKSKICDIGQKGGRGQEKDQIWNVKEKVTFLFGVGVNDQSITDFQ